MHFHPFHVYQLISQFKSVHELLSLFFKLSFKSLNYIASGQSILNGNKFELLILSLNQFLSVHSYPKYDDVYFTS